MNRHTPTPPSGVPECSAECEQPQSRVRELEAEILRLDRVVRTLTAANDGQCAACLEVGAAAERARVVAWLLKQARLVHCRGRMNPIVWPEEMASAIAAGVHLAPAGGEGEP